MRLTVLAFCIAAFITAFLSYAIAGERVSTRMICVTERAVMSIVEAEMNGGVLEINRVLIPLLSTNQCRVSSHLSYVVELKTMIMQYKGEGGLSEVWETKRGLFIIALNPDGSV